MIIILSISALVAAIVLAWALWPERERPRVIVDQRADTPCGFGLSTSWLALRTRDTVRVTQLLGLGELQRASWRGGVAAVYDDRLSADYVFVTPPVAGWTFVVGLALPQPVGARFEDTCTPLLQGMAHSFIEVQYYLSDPVLDFYAWAKLVDGRMVRAFAWSDEGVIWSKGHVSKEERSLGLRPFEARAAGGGAAASSGGSWGPGTSYPGEDHVMALAGMWSIDPTRLDTADTVPSLGFLGRTPSHWRASLTPLTLPQPIDEAGRPNLKPVR